MLVHAATAAEALVALRSLGIDSILVEGGAGLAGALLQDLLVDRLIIFRAPLILGAGALNAFGATGPHLLHAAPRWRLVHSTWFGDDEMTVYAPHT